MSYQLVSYSIYSQRGVVENTLSFLRTNRESREWSYLATQIRAHTQRDIYTAFPTNHEPHFC